MNSKSSTKETTKNNIIEAFWQIYRKKPIEKITVGEVCQKSGYSRNTFYNYFDNVYEVMEALCKKLANEMTLQYEPDGHIGLVNMQMLNFNHDTIRGFFNTMQVYKDVINRREFYPTVDRYFINDYVLPMFRKAMKPKGTREEEIFNMVMQYRLYGMRAIMRYYMSNAKIISMEEFDEIVTRISIVGDINTLRELMGD